MNLYLNHSRLVKPVDTGCHHPCTQYWSFCKSFTRRHFSLYPISLHTNRLQLEKSIFFFLIRKEKKLIDKISHYKICFVVAVPLSTLLDSVTLSVSTRMISSSFDSYLICATKKNAGGLTPECCCRSAAKKLASCLIVRFDFECHSRNYLHFLFTWVNL